MQPGKVVGVSVPTNAAKTKIATPHYMHRYANTQSYASYPLINAEAFGPPPCASMFGVPIAIGIPFPDTIWRKYVLAMFGAGVPFSNH